MSTGTKGNGQWPIAFLAAVEFGVRAATAPRAKVPITAAVAVLGGGSTGVGAASARSGGTLTTGGGSPLGTGGRVGADICSARFIVALARAKGGRSGVVGVGETVLEDKIVVGLADLGQIYSRLENRHKGGTKGFNAATENIELSRVHGRGSERITT